MNTPYDTRWKEVTRYQEMKFSAFWEEIRNSYVPIWREAKEQMDAAFLRAKDQTVITRYSSGSKNVFPHGFFYPSLVQDRVASNVKRGKIVAKKGRNAEYEYMYSDSGELLLIHSCDEPDIPAYVLPSINICGVRCDIVIINGKMDYLTVYEYEGDILRGFVTLRANPKDLSQPLGLLSEVYFYRGEKEVYQDRHEIECIRYEYSQGLQSILRSVFAI